jgi:hypothetical protein
VSRENLNSAPHAKRLNRKSRRCIISSVYECENLQLIWQTKLLTGQTIKIFSRSSFTIVGNHGSSTNVREKLRVDRVRISASTCFKVELASITSTRSIQRSFSWGGHAPRPLSLDKDVPRNNSPQFLEQNLWLNNFKHTSVSASPSTTSTPKHKQARVKCDTHGDTLSVMKFLNNDFDPSLVHIAMWTLTTTDL